jgi:hypothetical protein
LTACAPPEGEPIPLNTLAELRRDMVRRRLVSDQIRQIGDARLERLKQAPGDGPHAMVRLLARVIGVGVETADMLVQEVLSRSMRDRRAVARYAGLTGSPDESGRKRREKGLTRTGCPVLFWPTVARPIATPCGATSSTLRLTRSQPLSLLSIARLNIAKSRTRSSTWSLVRIAQTFLSRRGGFEPMIVPLSMGSDASARDQLCFVFSCSSPLLSPVAEADQHPPFVAGRSVRFRFRGNPAVSDSIPQSA